MDLRALVHLDLPLLGRWLRDPEVAAWWTDDPGQVAAAYAGVLAGTDPTRCWIAEVGGEPVGFGQAYALADEPAWRRAIAAGWPRGDGVGIDYLLGEPTARGRGLGPRLVGALLEEVSAVWGEEPVVVTVSAGNRRSWRSLERAGFTRRWTGLVVSDDPSDAGEQHLYVHGV